MRDRRFVAVHRGGPLPRDDHRTFAAWAADVAEDVLPLFETVAPSDVRPRRAIETARAWSRAEVPVGAGQRASSASHAAAREVAPDHPAAIAAARACGHAPATAHMAEHALGPIVYGVKAVAASGGDVTAWRDRQLARLPARLRELVATALVRRLGEDWPAPRRHPIRRRTAERP